MNINKFHAFSKFKRLRKYIREQREKLYSNFNDFTDIDSLSGKWPVKLFGASPETLSLQEKNYFSMWFHVLELCFSRKREIKTNEQSDEYWDRKSLAFAYFYVTGYSWKELFTKSFNELLRKILRWKLNFKFSCDSNYLD